MQSTLQITDEESKAVAKSQSTRVSLDDIKANISSEYVFLAHGAIKDWAPAHDALNVLTICIIVMKNGFTIIGKSAPADPQNFNKELGEKLAREDAIRQIWPLMGYELRERLMKAA